MDLPQSSTYFSPPKRVCRARTPGVYRGVRMRAWGKWVSEIRVPKTGQRIWLGSYDEPEQAARAYDAAVYCIHGECGQFNFPASRRPELCEGHVVSLTRMDIKAIALSFASEAAAVSSPMSSATTSQVVMDPPALADVPVSFSETNAGAADSYVPSSAAEAASNAFETLQLDDFLMLDIECIDSI